MSNEKEKAPPEIQEICQALEQIAGIRIECESLSYSHWWLYIRHHLLYGEVEWQKERNFGISLCRADEELDPFSSHDLQCDTAREVLIVILERLERLHKHDFEADIADSL